MSPLLASPLTIRTMMTPEEAKLKLIIADAAAEFPAIVGAPTNDDLKRILEFITNLLQSIDIPGGCDNLSGLIDTPSDYLAAYLHSFDHLKKPLVAYDPSISSDAMQAVRIKAKRAWTCKLEHQCLICTVEHQPRTFFAAIIKETWLLPLKDSTTFYNKVKIRPFLGHLSSSSGVPKATDIVHLLSAMLGWWDKDPCVPKYIN
jgi:hypothetical protein